MTEKNGENRGERQQAADGSSPGPHRKPEFPAEADAIGAWASHHRSTSPAKCGKKQDRLAVGTILKTTWRRLLGQNKVSNNGVIRIATTIESEITPAAVSASIPSLTE